MRLPCISVILCVLLTMTLFLPGEQPERSGVFHLPAMLWLLAAAAWTLWPLKRLLSKSNEKTDKDFPVIAFGVVDFFVYGFFLYVIVSLFWNLLPGVGGSPRAALNTFSVWLGLAAAWFLFRQILTDIKATGTVLLVVVAVLFGEALTGLYQQAIDIPQIQRQFEADPVKTIRQVDPSIEPDSPNWERLAARIRTAGPMGTYPMTNSLGGLLGFGFVFLLALRFFGDDSQKFSLRNDALFFIVTATILLCLVLTKCRSAYVGVAVGIVLVAAGVLIKKFHKKPETKTVLRRSLRMVRLPVLLFIAVSISVVVLSVMILSTTPGKNLLGGAKRSLGFRLEYWSASIGMVREYPIFGCGSGNFKQTYTKYKRPESSEEISDPHNFAVELAAVSGVPALLLFLAAGGAVVWCCIRKKKDIVEPSDERDSTAKMAFWAGLFGCWLGFILSFNTEAPVDFTAPILMSVAFPIVAFGTGLHRRLEKVPPFVLIVAATTLLVHLSAAGGISVSSTAIVLWLLGAILARNTEFSSEKSNTVTVRVVLGGVMLAAVVVVNRYGLGPVLESQNLMFQASEEKMIPRRVMLLDQAVEADPYSPVVREHLAAECFRIWSEFPNDENWKRKTLAAQKDTLQLAPRSAGLHFVFAERMKMMYEKTKNLEYRGEALDLYEKAIELYPNHARFRVPYALLLKELPERADEALLQRNNALELDDITPHADQKLPAAQRETLLDSAIWESKQQPE